MRWWPWSVCGPISLRLCQCPHCRKQGTPAHSRVDVPLTLGAGGPAIMLSSHLSCSVGSLFQPAAEAPGWDWERMRSEHTTHVGEQNWDLHSTLFLFTRKLLMWGAGQLWKQPVPGFIQLCHKEAPAASRQGGTPSLNRESKTDTAAVVCDLCTTRSSLLPLKLSGIEIMWVQSNVGKRNIKKQTNKQNQDFSWGWADDSVDNTFATKAWEPEFKCPGSTGAHGDGPIISVL